jgi:hypothetical protein
VGTCNPAAIARKVRAAEVDICGAVDFLRRRAGMNADEPHRRCRLGASTGFHFSTAFNRAGP